MFGFLAVRIPGIFVATCSRALPAYIAMVADHCHVRHGPASVLLFPGVLSGGTYLPVGQRAVGVVIPAYWFWGITAFFSAHADRTRRRWGP